MDLGEVWVFEWSGGTLPPQVLLQFWQNVENSFLAQNFLKRPIFLKSGMYGEENSEKRKAKISTLIIC